MMTTAEMVSKLGLRLNREAPESDFSFPERLMFLNDGQLYVCGKLPIDMVRPIETVSSAQAVDATGGVSLSGLTPKILNGDRGILDVKHSSGYYCREIEDDDEWRTIQEYSTVLPSTAPGYRPIGTKIILNPFTYGTTTAIIRYRSVPVAITTAAPCALADDVQELIVDHAVYSGLRAAKRYNDAGAVLRLVERQISDYRNSYVKSQPVRFEAATVLGQRSYGSDVRTRS